MKLNTSNIEELAQLAQQAAQLAADYIQTQVRKTHEIQHKTGVSSLATQVVTAIDVESQRIILDHLAPSIKSYKLGILTEESIDDGSRFEKNYFWCIDPLDGTWPFTQQKPGYAVSIALVSRLGDPIIGVVTDPYHQVSYLAMEGRGVLKNNQAYEKAKSKPSGVLHCYFDESFLASASYPSTRDQLHLISERLDCTDLEIHSGYGAVMNALSLLDTDTGCYFKFPKTNRGGGCSWDYAATRLIYEELALWASTAQGEHIPLNNSDTPYLNEHGVIYATTKELHQELISLEAQRKQPH
ncbi:3'(2'), 5'-bisphosphate nucleotidase [Reichenbachiella faecimaris]|uniref:3'(2'), 5'-bisphosphate nucleotidase n=1 Tax=Reichenbachiella faecimaris TaxID=692418 RepID=A0A1W2G634_REIFA|nr:inositol monophosphatase family protein [Reichenbachiella faecimaris]SMD31828.1 3'(2'), 5'-bisphosphate nucleotidase [Reichenbachiella faecimaris]